MGASGAPALIPSVPARIAMLHTVTLELRLVGRTTYVDAAQNGATVFCSTATAAHDALTTTPSQRTQRRILHRSRRFLQAAGRRGHSHPQTPVNCDNSTGFIGSMNLIAPTCHTQVHLQHARGSIVASATLTPLTLPGSKTYLRRWALFVPPFFAARSVRGCTARSLHVVAAEWLDLGRCSPNGAI